MVTETAQATSARPRGEHDRTIARLWRDAVAAGRPGPAYLTESDEGGWTEVSWSEADERVRAYANGVPRARRAQG